MHAIRPKSDVTRWRQKARDPKARAAHTADTTSWRRSVAEADFDPDEHAELFEGLRAGLKITEAAAAVGMTANACPAGDVCGRPAGVKHGGHCASCRRAHHPPRATGWLGDSR